MKRTAEQRKNVSDPRHPLASQFTQELIEDIVELKNELKAEKDQSQARIIEFREAARRLWDDGWLELPHVTTCPEDDTCDCKGMGDARLLINDDVSGCALIDRIGKLEAVAKAAGRVNQALSRSRCEAYPRYLIQINDNQSDELDAFELLKRLNAALTALAATDTNDVG